jgi:hypothetical protein
MYSKILYLLSSILLFYNIHADTCYTKNDVVNSKTLFTYQGNVYDITGYKHPAGKSTLLKPVGGALEEWLDLPKYDFHYSKNSFKNDMKDLLVGPLKTSCSRESTTINVPTYSLNDCDNSTSPTQEPSTSSTHESSTDDPLLSEAYKFQNSALPIIMFFSLFF